MPEDRPARHSRPSRGRQGFTFVELIVGLAIMVMVASVVTPVLLGALDRARIETTIETFLAIGTAVLAFDDDVDEWPGQMTHLTTQITGAQDNVCGNNYSTAGGGSDVNQWDGPYTSRLVTANGLPVPVGRMRNQFGRFPASGGSLTQLRILVDSVAVEDAEAVNLEVDGDGSSTAGLVLWSLPAVEGLTVMTLVVPATNC